jgi:hypothetical protein
VAGVIDAEPGVLERSDTERARLRAEREARADHLAGQALVAIRSGDYDRAVHLIDQAEMLDPDYQPGRSNGRPAGVSWGQIRQAITARRDGTPQPGRPADAADGTDGTRVPANAAQLARLDGAPGVPAGSALPVVARTAHQRGPATTGHQPGPSV